jgi:hypothetical protein
VSTIDTIRGFERFLNKESPPPSPVANVVCDVRLALLGFSPVPGLTICTYMEPCVSKRERVLQKISFKKFQPLSPKIDSRGSIRAFEILEYLCKLSGVLNISNLP